MKTNKFVIILTRSFLNQNTKNFVASFFSPFIFSVNNFCSPLYFCSPRRKKMKIYGSEFSRKKGKNSGKFLQDSITMIPHGAFSKLLLKEKGTEGKQWKVSQTAANASNKHNQHHFPSCLHCDYVFFSFVVAQSGALIRKRCSWRRGRTRGNRSMIVNFHP
jgi:hypothetical protein